MTTVAEIVTRAFRKVGIAAAGEALQANELQDGIDALNMMLHAWKLRSVDIEHVDYKATDAFALAPEFEEGTVYNLASRLSPDYEVPANFDADAWWRSIQNAYCDPASLTLELALTEMPSATRYYF